MLILDVKNFNYIFGLYQKVGFALDNSFSLKG